MFSGFMMSTWIAATIVAVIAGVVGFFAVLRGSTFAAHAIPNGAFAGAAGASLLGISTLVGLVVFSVAGALGIGVFGRRARHDVATALALVLMLGLGALFISVSTEYAQETYSLLFGEVFGVSPDELLPIAILGAASILAIGVIFRPLMLSSAMPEVAEARGVSSARMEMVFLLIMALATSMTVPVVGALLMFSLMIGPAAAARSFTPRPGLAIVLSIAFGLATVWTGIAVSYVTNWPLGFFVGVLGAVFYLAGRAWATLRRTRSVRAAGPAAPPRSPRSRFRPLPVRPTICRILRLSHHTRATAMAPSPLLLPVRWCQRRYCVPAQFPGRGHVARSRGGTGVGRAEVTQPMTHELTTAEAGPGDPGTRPDPAALAA